MIRERGLLRRSPRRLMPPARRHSPPPRPVSPEESRRILLARQGLATPPAARSGPRSVARLVHRLGFVQVDSINVVERAHHLILHTRFEAYRPSTLTRLLEHERSLFEHWTHDASVIPLEFHAHWRPRFRRYEQRAEHRAWWKERLGRDPDALLARVLGRIRSDGPARARDFEDERRDAEGGSWWNWHPGKAALEHLWRTGRLAIAGRNGFEKIYDLAERVHPSTRSQAEPTDEEHVDWACRTALDRLGVATPAEIAAFWKSIPLARARAWCRSRIDEGEFEAIVLEDLDGRGRPGIATSSAWRDARTPPWSGAFRILCPFDPVIRDRDRLRRRFGFDYRFEAFTPAAKRRHGYYVLPIIEGDRFVARIDPKFDREAGRLSIRGPWWEPGRGSKSDRRRLDQAIDRLAACVGAETWVAISP